jgi:hypothetical protein
MSNNITNAVIFLKQSTLNEPCKKEFPLPSDGGKVFIRARVIELKFIVQIRGALAAIELWSGASWRLTTIRRIKAGLLSRHFSGFTVLILPVDDHTLMFRTTFLAQRGQFWGKRRSAMRGKWAV